MKIRKILLSFILVVALSFSFALPAFAATVVKEETAVKEEAVSKETEKDASAKESPYIWEKVDGKWTCTREDGTPVKGWAVRDEYVYYMNKKGVMRTGWICTKGEWYYLYRDEDNVKEDLVGTLVTDAWIDNYYVDKNGVWVKTR